MQQPKKVKCITTFLKLKYTLDKEYDVVKEFEHTYLIKDDKGKQEYCIKSYFEDVTTTKINHTGEFVRCINNDMTIAGLEKGMELEIIGDWKDFFDLVAPSGKIFTGMYRTRFTQPYTKGTVLTVQHNIDFQKFKERILGAFTKK